MVFQKVDLVGPNSHPNFVVSGPKLNGIFSPIAGGIAVDILVFRFFDILIHFADTCDRILKLSEIALNFARFWLKIFVGGAPHILGPKL